MRRLTIFILFVLALLLVGCGGGDDPPEAGEAGGGELFTPPAAAASALPPPIPATETPVPPTGSPAELPPSVPTPTPCVNDALFVEDVTIPDFTEVQPGEVLDKQWRVQNTGSCLWTAAYRVAFREGAQMAPDNAYAVYPAQPGADGVIRIEMRAPDIPGEYIGRWELRDGNGTVFGPVLFINITVVAPAEGDGGGDG